VRMFDADKTRIIELTPPTAREDVFLEDVLRKLRKVVRWSTVSKFSKGRSGFNPNFGETEKIRTMRIYKV